MKPLDLYIGYDPREAVAYHVCSNSAIRHSSSPLAIHPIAQKNIEGYKDPQEVIHGYPQTNQFIFSRFLVPYLQGFGSCGKVALFLDGDQWFRDDPTKLFDIADLSTGKAVWVVKHDYKTKSNTKYLDQANYDYPRKNWSSVVIWNCGHHKHKILTPEFISKSSGSYLHRFEWLDDDDIGEIPIEWNWLSDEFGENKEAKLVHSTLGTPCFLDEQYSTGPMSSEWHRERMLTNYCMQTFVP